MSSFPPLLSSYFEPSWHHKLWILWPYSEWWQGLGSACQTHPLSYHNSHLKQWASSHLMHFFNWTFWPQKKTPSLVNQSGWGQKMTYSVFSQTVSFLQTPGEKSRGTSRKSTTSRKENLQQIISSLTLPTSSNTNQQNLHRKCKEPVASGKENIFISRKLWGTHLFGC